MPRPSQHHRRRDPRHKHIPQLKSNTSSVNTMHYPLPLLFTAIPHVFQLHRGALRYLVFRYAPQHPTYASEESKFAVSPTGTVFKHPFKTPDSTSATGDKGESSSPAGGSGQLPHSRHFLGQPARRRNAIRDLDPENVFGPVKKEQSDSEDADDEKSTSSQVSLVLVPVQP